MAVIFLTDCRCEQRMHNFVEYVSVDVEPLNMLIPWGHTAACDLEKQSRVMGILNKWSEGRRETSEMEKHTQKKERKD